MKKLGLISLFFLIIVLLSGCNTILEAKGPLYGKSPIPEHDSNKATVYVYRTDLSVHYAHRVQPHIDGKYLVTLKYRGFTWFQIEPGEHEISIEIPWSERDLFSEYNPKKLVFSVEAGKTYYINYDIDTVSRGYSTKVEVVAGIPVAYGQENLTQDEGLKIVDEKVARETIQYHKYQTPEWK